MDYEALWLTVRLAATTTILLLLLALPTAWWIARPDALEGSRPAWLPAAAQALVALPLVLPPTVIGFYLLVGLGPLTAFGRAISTLFGHPLAFTFSGLLVGSLVYSLPFAVQPLVAGFQSIDPGFLDTAAGLGMTPAARFFGVALPLTRGSLLTAAVLTFTHTVGEFGVVLMIGGNIPGQTRTLSIAIYDQVSNGDYRSAAIISVVLVLISAFALFFIYVRSGITSKRAIDAW